MQYLYDLVDSAGFGQLLAIWSLLGFGLVSSVSSAFMFWAEPRRGFLFCLGSAAMVGIAGAAHTLVHSGAGDRGMFFAIGTAAVVVGALQLIASNKFLQRITANHYRRAWADSMSSVAVANFFAGTMIADYGFPDHRLPSGVWFFHVLLLALVVLTLCWAARELHKGWQHTRLNRYARRLYAAEYAQGPQGSPTRSRRPWWWYAQWLGSMSPMPFVPYPQGDE